MGAKGAPPAQPPVPAAKTKAAPKPRAPRKPAAPKPAAKARTVKAPKPAAKRAAAAPAPAPPPKASKVSAALIQTARAHTYARLIALRPVFQVIRRSATLSRPEGDEDKVTHLRKIATSMTEEQYFFEGLGVVDDTRVVIIEEKTVRKVAFALVDDQSDSAWGRGWVKAMYLSDYEAYEVTPQEASSRAAPPLDDDRASEDEEGQRCALEPHTPLPHIQTHALLAFADSDNFSIASELEESEEDEDNEEESEESEQTYIINKILDSKREGRSIFYLVQWEGFDASANSWEPTSCIRRSNPALKEFLKDKEN